MKKIIKEQLVASTHLDLHGERLSRKTIKKFFKQIPEIFIMNNFHDLSKPPIAKGFNKRLKELPDGELAIILDVEIYDKIEYNKMGGFSISFTRQTIRYGQNKPSVRILINPHQFDLQDTANEIAQLLPEKHTIEVTERIEKGASLDTAIIIVVIFATLEISRGFLNAAGAEIFNVLRKLKRKDKKDLPQKLQIQVNIEIKRNIIPILLIPSDKISNNELSNIDISELNDIVKSFDNINLISRIIGEINPGPQYKLKYIIDINGKAKLIK